MTAIPTNGNLTQCQLAPRGLWGWVGGTSPRGLTKLRSRCRLGQQSPLRLWVNPWLSGEVRLPGTRGRRSPGPGSHLSFRHVSLFFNASRHFPLIPGPQAHRNNLCLITSVRSLHPALLQNLPVEMRSCSQEYTYCAPKGLPQGSSRLPIRIRAEHKTAGGMRL